MLWGRTTIPGLSQVELANHTDRRESDRRRLQRRHPRACLLVGADLTSATLFCAVLIDTDLTAATRTEANMSKVDLTGKGPAYRPS